MAAPANRVEPTRTPAAVTPSRVVTPPSPLEAPPAFDGAPELAALGPQQLLALQRYAGNAAVSGLIDPPPPSGTGPTVQRQPPDTGKAIPPKVTAWGAKLTKGGLGAGEDRTLGDQGQKVFVGDKMTVTAEFGRLTPEQKQGITFLYGHPSDNCEITPGDWRGNKLTWEITFKKVGPLTTMFSAMWGETNQPLEFGDHNENFDVVTDLIDFIMAIEAAQSQIISRFASASQKLNEAAGAFRAAQADQDAALKDVGAQEKMIEDLLWGALFAAAGGAAGGAVGGALKSTLSKLGDVKSGAVTDAAKDTVKFAVRSLDKIRTSGSSSPSTAGDSTAPPTATSPPGGERSAAGQNPLDFLTSVAGKIEGDKVLVQNQLTQVIQAARQARAANSKADFDEDPMEVATRKSDLDDITSQLNTEKKYYLKELWHSWLGAYGYKLGSYDIEGMSGKTVEGNVNSKVRKAIMKAAEQCGEDGNAWITNFTEELRQKLQAQADKENAASQSGQGGPTVQ